MDFDQFPDPDKLDQEVEFESAYRTLRQKLTPLFEGDENVTLAQINKVAQQQIGGYKNFSEVVLATLKAMLRDKVIRKVDRDTFCNYEIGPRLRSIDDAFAAYAFEEPAPKSKLPSKKDIINDIARVARTMEGMFSMGELVKQWTKMTTPYYINAVKPVFGISKEMHSNVKRIFLSIMQKLVDEKVIKPHRWAEDQFEAVPPKVERFRSLDDDWC